MLITILAFLVVFGTVVFVHELGHFLAAKSVGVYAPRFAIGFGPTLFRRRRGETEYVIGALPLGGYVRMASREDEATAFLEGGSETKGRVPAVGANDTPTVAGEHAVTATEWDPEAMMPFGPKPVPEHRWFESKPLWARVWILSAGVLMNFLLGLVVSIGLVMAAGKTIVPTRVVGTVDSVASPALAARVQVGDTILAVNGHTVTTWNDVARELLTAPGDSITLRTNRGEATVPAGARDSEARVRTVSALGYFEAPRIGRVLDGSPAARAGLRPGDLVRAVNGAPVRSFAELVDRVTPLAGQRVVLDVERDGRPTQLVVAKADSARAPDPVTRHNVVVGRIGASPVSIATREPVGPVEGVRNGVIVAWDITTGVFRTLKGLFTGSVSVKELGGPIAIARSSGEAARGGAEQLVYLIALLSINVAILNLLPIPVLDGGQILLNVAEAIKGGSFSARTRENVLRIGLAAILLLFVTVMWNDLARIFAERFR